MKEGINVKKLYIPLLVLTLVLGLTLSGCKKKEEVDSPVLTPPVENPSVDVGQEDKNDFIKEFADILDSESQPDKIISFIDDNLDKLSELQGDIMIDGLERKLEKNLDPLMNRIFDLDKDNELMEIGGEYSQFLEEDISKIQNKELKAEVEKAYDNMYKLFNSEGQFYPIIDYIKLQKYNDYLTDEWRDYLAIMAEDSEDPPLTDGALRIKFDELAKRLILTETYLNSYVDGQRQEEMLAAYEHKITIYLKGAPNTPIADRETNIIDGEVEASYQKYSNVENYMTSYIVYKYLDFIKENHNIIDENIFNEADKLIAEVMEILREYK